MNQPTPPKLTERTTDQLLGDAARSAVLRPTLTLEDAGARGYAMPFQMPPDPAVTIAQPPRNAFRPEKVAIIGTAPSSRLLAPFNDPSWTIWGTSPGNMGNLPRFDAWIEVHSNMLWPEYRSYGEPYVNWLNAGMFPFMAANKAMFPRATEFPWKQLVEEFGPYFYSSTFAWCMALAIHVGVKEMALYGVDMSSKDEYILQRPGGHYFIQKARERGINVVIPPESDLAQPPPLYGLSDSTTFGRKMAAREQEVRARIAEAMQRQANVNAEITYLNGALEDIGYVRNIAGVAINPVEL
jgi:hypothetical protein